VRACRRDVAGRRGGLERGRKRHQVRGRETTGFEPLDIEQERERGKTGYEPLEIEQLLGRPLLTVPSLFANKNARYSRGCGMIMPRSMGTP